MPSLSIPTLPEQAARDYFLCGCPATWGDPADFCDACRADYEFWLDRLFLEREAEMTAAFASEGGVV